MSRVLLFAILGSACAFADPLTITISGTGSGTWGGRIFYQSAFTFTSTTDSSTVVKPSCCNALTTGSGTPTTFTVAALGSGSLTGDQSVYTFGSAGSVGLTHYNGNDVLDFDDPALKGYAFDKSIGPLTGMPSYVGACPGSNCSSFETNAGTFSFSAVSSVTLTIVRGGTATQAPAITKVLDQAAGSTHLTAGMPIEIIGAGLGASATDAATIMIGSRTAPILSFITSTDLIAQIPTDVPVGTTAVTVSYKGATSAAFPIQIDSLAPHIQKPVSGAFFDTAGKVITAAHPAPPNTQVYLVAIGLGATNPAQGTNVIAASKAATTLPVQVMVGNKLVPTDYAGLFVGGTPGTYQVLFKVPADVPAGDQTVTIIVGGITSNPVTLTVAAPGPVIGAVVNAATYQAKGAAPNSFLTIFGTSFGTQDTATNIFPATAFQGVSVLFNGVPAPLYYVFGSLGQINLVLPSELPEGGTVNVQVQTAQGTSAAFPVQTAAADVGLFRIPDPSKPSRNNGAVLIANTVWRVMPSSMATAIGFPSCAGATPSTVCGQPANTGDTLVVFLTGLGKATPNGDAAGQPLATGSIAPVSGSPLYYTVLKPTAKIGGIATPVLFSGITPGNAALYQINLAIPGGVQPGDDVPIVITMPNGSTDTVTIAVR